MVIAKAPRLVPSFPALSAFLGKGTLAKTLLDHPSNPLR